MASSILKDGVDLPLLKVAWETHLIPLPANVEQDLTRRWPWTLLAGVRAQVLPRLHHRPTTATKFPILGCKMPRHHPRGLLQAIQIQHLNMALFGKTPGKAGKQDTVPPSNHHILLHPPPNLSLIHARKI